MFGDSIIEALQNLACAFVPAALIALISFRLRALNFSGAVGLILVGTIVFGLGGIVFAAPLIVFFVTSSLLSLFKSGGKDKAILETGKTGPRDIWQVLANGSIATLAVVTHFITGNNLWYPVYLAAVAEAAADTWATEIGLLSNHKPLSIISFREMEPGRSGGITFLGTAFSLSGAILIIISGLICMRIVSGGLVFAFDLWIAAAIAGWIGALFDSVLGATVQARFRCPECGKITEKTLHCQRKTMLFQGSRLINNDMVNFISTLFAALLMLAII